jgi:7,8-dihydroneopterin aldolase/epimerase/oxygenase
MGRIMLEDMEFFGYHGCFQEEQVIGNRFVVNLEMETDTASAERSDRLEETVNYQTVYMVIGEQMNQKSHLLEHLARRILDAISSTFPQVSFMRLKVSKMNPPMGGKMHAVSVELVYPAMSK